MTFSAKLDTIYMVKNNTAVVPSVATFFIVVGGSIDLATLATLPGSLSAMTVDAGDVDLKAAVVPVIPRYIAFKANADTPTSVQTSGLTLEEVV